MADVDALRNALLQTQSPALQQRRDAEAFLTTREKQPAYAQTLIQVVEQHAAGSTPQDKVVRSVAAIMFKQFVVKYWAEPEEAGDFTIPLADKNSIKEHMVHLMCVVPADVQRQLSEALSAISEYDFPAKWPTLLPDLVSKFKDPSDYRSILGALETTNSILKRFRYVFQTDDVLLELKYTLEQIQEPLLKLFLDVSGAVSASQEDKERLGTVFQALYLISRIFYSLNWQDLPEFFEDHLSDWMGGFLRFMTYENPLLVDASEELVPDPLSKMQAAVVEGVNLYATKYEEEFTPQLAGFTQAIWGLLLKVGPLRKHDNLATTCIRFLTSIVSKSHNSELFKDENTLRQIAENIVVPNITIREADEELFEDNPTDYIQRDMEGSDSDTRRRCGCDLIKGMCKQYEESTTRICSEYIGKLLQQYSTSPETHWKAKDAALQLLLALGVRAQSAAHGVSQTNKFMNVMDVFASNVLPEIQDTNVNARPVVKADCIKFVTTFRNQFTLEQLTALMPLLINHLCSESIVVHTYAAVAIERILTVKGATPPTPSANALGGSATLLGGGTGAGTKQRFGKESLQPFLQPLFTNLFGVLDKADLAENEYLMKAVMRSLSTAQEAVLPVSQVVLARLTAYLARVCKNPANPHFNHFLFESIAVLVGKVCEADVSVIDQFEQALFPPFQQVLSLDVIEFAPYVFQILAQMLELRAGGFTAAYTGLFPPLLSPVLWERKGNVPALVRLMQAYLRKDAPVLCAAGHLPPILGVFQKLLSAKATEVSGMNLLCVVVERCLVEQFKMYLPELFKQLLMRLQSNKTLRYVRALLHFFSLLSARHGPVLLQQCLEGCQPGMLNMIIKQVWLDMFKTGAPAFGKVEQKVYVIGMVKLLCDPLRVKGGAEDENLWTSFFSITASILIPADSTSKDLNTEEAMEAGRDAAEEVTYDSTYSQLHFAKTKGDNFLADMPDARQVFAQSLAGLTASQPGVYPALIQQAISPMQLQSLQGLCSSAGVSLA